MKTWNLGDESQRSEVEKLVDNYTAGADVNYDQRLAVYDIYGSIAHVHALEQLNLVGSSEAERLRDELRSMLARDLNLTSSDEDVHTRVENEITDALGELGQKLHTARSRNDQVLVDIRLYMKAEIFKAVRKLLGLAESLLTFARDHLETPMVGYTHYRKAMPSSVGLWAGSYAESLVDDLLPIGSSYELIDQSPLGVGAGYGVPVSLDRELTADLLGFEKVQNNAIYVMNSRGKFEFNVITALANVQIDLSRLSSDLITFSDGHFDYFDIPEEFTTGSSIMPQKKNPDVLELVRARSASFSGHLSSLYSLLHGLRSGYSRDLQKTKGTLIDGLDSTLATLEIVSLLVSGIEVNEEELISAFSGEVFATDEVFDRVKKGVPFRRAYREVKANLDSDGGDVSEKRTKEAISSRDHPGGPGNIRLEGLKKSIESEKEKWKKREVGFQRCLKELEKPETDGQ